jgi:DNA helicase-2/ATP-dependent DNA helicase PcrA
VKKNDGVVRLNNKTALLKPDPDFLKQLDEDQLMPVKDIDGPSLVIAGAGSGKTRVIVYRVANMIYQDIKPEEILMMTFTNKAAREMKDRIGTLIGNKVNGLTCGTYHHVGNLILRKYSHLVGLKSNYTIMDQDDVKSLLKMARLSVDGKNKLIPKEKVIQEIISLSINTNLPIEHIIQTQFNAYILQVEVIVQIAREYMRLKLKSNVVDYDDILFYWRLILKKNENVRSYLSNKYKYLLIDEYQDTNRLQSDIVSLMVGIDQNIMVVGDPNQSVYSWRGAEIDNILNFKNDYEGCSVYHVAYNYRSTESVLNLANESINNNIKRSDLKLKAKNDIGMKPGIYNFPDSEAEASYVVQVISELIEEGIDLKDIAVLYRNHYFAKDVEIQLTKNNIPYELRSGVKFFDKKHIKDVISYVRINHNIQDEVSWHRTLQQLEGVGDKTVKTIVDNLMVNEDNIREFIINEKEYKFVKRGKENFIPFMDMFRNSLEVVTVQEIINNFLNGHYENYLKMNFDNYEDRLDDVKALIDYSFKYDNIENFLEDISLLEEVYGKDDTEEDKREKDKIVLSTIHRSKGLEWKYVFLISCTEGKFPSVKSLYSDDYLEEERRLFYVAVTRAERELYISYINMEYSHEQGRRVLVKPSKFLTELSENVYNHYTFEA